MTEDRLERLRVSLAGRYAILREIGAGGMARVYLGQDLRLDRPVALKVLRPEIAASLGAERFLREIRIAAQLNHPHIVALFESGEVDGLLYYVMPYVDGESLRDRLEREQNQLPIEDALKIVEQVASALSYAHALGIVHRDIKPANILLASGEAVVTDFGIARAVSQAGEEGITETGIVVGTPAYMAPEQAMGSEHVDQRADIYALGCVLYEMLVGEPPFTGPNREAILRQQRASEPRSVSIVRPSVPPDVDRLVHKALARTPADRFSTASQMMEAVVAVQRGDTPLRLRGPLGWLGAAVATVVIVVFLLATLPPRRPALALDRESYAVVAPPWSLALGVDPVDLRSAMDRTTDALKRAGVTVRDPVQVDDRLARLGQDTFGFDRGLRVAESLAAGRLVYITPVREGDSLTIVATLFDVAKGEEIKRGAGRLDEPERAVEQLLDASPGSLRVPRTLNPTAAREYAQGHLALGAWQLDSAESHFLRAAELDSDFADAHLFVARVRSWRGDEHTRWRVAAQHAVRLAARLANERDRSAARALLAMGEGHFPEACEEYERIVADEPINFEAWFGLGECHRRDRTVVTDADSPSGWSFRSSVERAVNAYREALLQAVSFNFTFRQAAYERLGQLFFARNSRRFGGGGPPDTTRIFVALPALRADTFAFVPYPFGPAADTRAPVDIPALDAAAERIQGIIAQVVGEWAASFPNSSAAHRALAEALEAEGRLSSGDPDALSVMARARRVAANTEDSLLAGVAHARLLLKVGRYRDCRLLADSLLRTWTAPDSGQAYQLAGLAALLGRPHEAAALLARATPELQRVRAELVPAWRDVNLRTMQERERLRAYAAVGAPVDSVRALFSRTDSLVDIFEGGDRTRRLALRHLLLDDVAEWAFPALGATPVHRPAAENYLIRAQYRAATGDRVGLRRTQARLDSIRVGVRPGDNGPDGAFIEARLWLTLGDTADVIRRVDRSLAAARAYPTTLLREPQQAAGFVRLVALRAELGKAVGDSVAWARWRVPAQELWAGGDPAVRSLLVDLERY